MVIEGNFEKSSLTIKKDKLHASKKVHQRQSALSTQTFEKESRKLLAKRSEVIGHTFFFNFEV
jgi:hypothetical protein